MAVPSAQGGAGPPILPAPKPKAPPKPPVYVQPASTVPQPASSSLGAALGHALQSAGHAVGHAVSHSVAPSSGPGGDVQSGGANQLARGNAYKQTPQYRQAVASVFRSQPVQQKAAIIAGMVHSNAFSSPDAGVRGEFHAVRSVWDHLAIPEQTRIASTIPHDIGKFISPQTFDVGSALSSGVKDIGRVLSSVRVPGSSQEGQNIAQQSESKALGGPPIDTSLPIRKGLDAGLGAIENGLTAIQPNTNKFQSQGLSAGGVGQAIVHMPFNVTRAALQDPSVVPHTLKGLGETAIGAVPAIVSLGADTVTQGPSALVNAGKAMIADYKARYGGTDAQIIARIKASPQGAAPEVIDALTAAGLADATLGRAATGLAKGREALTGRPNILTRERPSLRVSGGVTREQSLANGAGKILAQRAEDKIRQTLAGRSEITPRPGEVPPVFGKRAQRIEASKVVARTRTLSQQALNAEIRSRKGAQGVVNRLSYPERKAFTVAVEGGIPLRSGADVAKQWIDRHIAIIEKDRQSVLSPGSRIAAQHAGQIDDLGLLKWMRANTDKWLTPKLAQAVDREGARAIKIDRMAAEGGALHPATAEARRLRVQGELHGIEHPNDAVVRQLADLKQHAADLQAQVANELRVPTRGAGVEASVIPKNRGGLAEVQADAASLRQIRAAQAELKRTQDSIAILQHPDTVHVLHEGYIQQVRAAAKAAGMPEQPGFLHHQPHPKTDFGAYTTGTGHAAMPGVKQSEFSLWRSGAVDRSPQAYVNGLAHSVKRPFQWRLTDEQFRASALPQPSATAIKAALGHAKPADKLTLFELKQAMLHDGVNMDHVMFYRPGRLKTSTLEDLRTGSLDARATGSSMTPSELEANRQIADALKQQDIVQAGSSQIPEAYAKQVGWKALPRAAYEEIHSSLQPSGLPGRLIGKTQGLNAMMILGGSPSFVVMNSLADVLVATLGTRGKLLADAVKYPLWAKGLSEQDLNWFKAHTGGRAGFHVERLGSTAKSDLVRSWRELGQRGLPRFLKAANPIAGLFHGQAAFSDFMRHVVQYSEMKRMALENIGNDMGAAARAFESVQQAFKLHPTAAVDQQLRDILGSQPALEQAGNHTLSMMGDYTRFTARERRYLNNRAILFYSFLRYATRMLFYTLPLHHPIMTGLVGELSKLHGDEVRKLLGGVDLPWAYSRIFIHGANGKLESIDTIRSSPVGSVGTDITTQGIQGLSQTIFPELQILLNQMYGKQPSGAPYPRGVFSALNDILSMSYLYRAGSTQHFGLQPQQADSIPFLHERPDVKKTAAGQAYQQAKMQASGPLLDKQLSSLLGVWPRPDNSQVVAGHMAAQQAKQAGGTGGYSITKPSTATGGYSIVKPSTASGGYSLLGAAGKGGGAEGMKAPKGGLLATAVQSAGSTAANMANFAAGQVGSQPLAIPAAFVKQQTAAVHPWTKGLWTPAKEQQMLTANPASKTQVQAQQSGTADTIAHLIDPAKPFAFLSAKPQFAQPKVPKGTSAGMTAVINMANSISANHYNYEWAGGHTKIGQPTGGPGPGFDCSGAVSAILHAAGLLSTPLVAAQFETYGKPGAGTKPNDVTIYASGSHVVSYMGGKYFGTSGQNPGRGAGWFKSFDPSGFVARHVTLRAGTTAQQVAMRAPAAAKWLVGMLPAQTQKALAKQATQAPMPTMPGSGQQLGGKGLPQNVTPTVFAAATLNGLGVKPTPANVQALTAWMAAEGGHWNNTAHFNPLNTTQPEPGYSQTGTQGNIGSYTSWGQGLKATIQTLRNGRYGSILAALQSPNVTPAALSAAVAGSPWGTGGFSASGVSISPAQARALATIGPLSTATGLPTGGPSVGGSVSAPAGSGLVQTGNPAVDALTQNLPSTQPADLLMAQAQAQVEQQNRLALLSQFLKGQGSSPWDIGPKSNAAGGGVNLGALGLGSSRSLLPAVPVSRKKAKV